MDSIISTSSLLSNTLKGIGSLLGNTRSILENFNSYSGAMSTDATWTLIRGSFYVTNGEVRSNTNNYRCLMAYNGTFPNDQFSELEYLDGASDGYIGPAVRCIDDSNFYACYLAGSGSYVRIYKYAEGSYTSMFLTSSLSPVINRGDIIRLEIVGNRLSFYVNGSKHDSIPDIIDSDVTYGNPGITGFNANESYADNFNAGYIQVLGNLTQVTNNNIESLINISTIVNSNIKGNTNLNSQINLYSSLTSLLNGRIYLVLTINTNSQLSTTLKGIGSLLSLINSESILISSLVSTHVLYSNINCSTNLNTGILGRGILLETINNSSSIQASLSLKFNISSVINTNSLLISTLKGNNTLESILNNTSSLTGHLISKANISSLVNLNSEVIGYLVGSTHLLVELNNSSILYSDIIGTHLSYCSINNNTLVQGNLTLKSINALNSLTYTNSNLIGGIKAKGLLNSSINNNTLVISLLNATAKLIMSISTFSSLESKLVVSNIILLNQEIFTITGPIVVTLDEDEVIEFKVIN